jgi:hypothetical protein
VRRLAAAGVAVLLIVGALIIRSRREEEERKGPFRLTCATEFAQVCSALPGVAVTIEPAAQTAAAEDPSYEAWLAGGQWTASTADNLGYTRVAMAIWRDRAGALRRACGTITSRCIGDAAARVQWTATKGETAWGPVKIAFADPLRESSGLAALASTTVGFLGTADFVPAQLDADDAYLGWLAALKKALVPQSLASVLTQGPGAADMYIGLDTEVTPAVAQAARRSELEVVYLAPVEFEARLVTASGARDAPPALIAALRTAGWASDRQQSSTPSAAALAGLRRIWKDVA